MFPTAFHRVIVQGFAWRLVWMASLWMGCEWPLAAAHPDVSKLSFQTWQTEHGLPQNHSTAIVQTEDGYLWLGTYNGLVRFDGVRFVVFNTANTPGLSSSRVTSLLKDHAGQLWIGHDGGELTHLRGDQFESVRLGNRWPGGTVVGLGEDSLGDVWALHWTGALVRARDGAIQTSEDALLTPAPVSLVSDVQHRLWRIHAGKIRCVESDSVSRPASVFPEDDFLIRACLGREGGLWLCGGEHLRWWSTNNAWMEWGGVPWGSDPTTAMLESRSGLLWVGTQSKGLFVLDRDHHFAQYTRTNGLAHDWVRSLGEDAEGNVWIGTGGGVCAARERSITMAEAPDHLFGRTVLSIHATPEGTIWMGTEGAGIYRLSDGVWTRFDEQAGLSNLFVWSILQDPRGRVWAGTWGGGLFQFSGGRFVRRPELADETLAITALVPDPDGSLWMGTQKGLARLKDDQLQRFAQDWPRSDVRCIALGAAGSIWFGMSGGGLGLLTRDGQLKCFKQADGLPSDFVWSLLPDPEDPNTLWIGTFGSGLCRYRENRFVTLNERQGLPNTVLTYLADSGDGALWMGSYGGILRARKSELHQCADGLTQSVEFHSLGRADGMASMECSGGLCPAGSRGPDGKFWIPTGKGAAVLDPLEWRTNAVAPPVIIEQVRVDGNPVEVRGKARWTVPPGDHRFEFHFTAPSFAAPERVRFRYRLLGLEEAWVDAGAKRNATYGFLPPGSFEFQVIAAQAGGPWTAIPASLHFELLPHLWQRTGFQLVAALLLSFGVAAMARIYTQQQYRKKLERVERQRVVERERARIAKDIHDDLGASLTRITLLSQTARTDLNQPEKAAADIDRIYSTARELTRAMDEIVWAVNPLHDSLDSLVNYLGRYAQQFLRDADIRCRLDVPLDLPVLSLRAEVRHNLFLSFKETLHNIVKHAGATEVRISLRLEEKEAGFVLSIEDNGRGFAVGQDSFPDRNPKGSGNGLSNIRQRLKDIGGVCEVTSQPGLGTRVQFRVYLRLDSRPR